MSQKKELAVSLIALFLTGIAIASLFSLFTKFSNTDSSIQPNPTISPKPSDGNTPEPVKEKISYGNKILIPKEESGDKNQIFQAAKQKGMEAIAAGNYTEAVVEFEKAIKNYQNAPETLIYLNNARIGNNKAYAMAIVTPISDDKDSALKMLRGIAQTQDEINKTGGINGVPIKVIIADDTGKPEIAKQVALELAKNPDILAVVGHHSSGTTLEAREVYESEKLVAISSTSTSVELSKPSTPNKRYVFRTVPNDRIAAKGLANYMLTKLNKRKVAVFYYPNSRYSKSLKEEFVGEVTQNQGEIVRVFELSEKDQDFDAFRYVKQVIDEGAEALMLASPYDKLTQILSVINVNDNRLHLLGGDDTYDIRILQQGGSRAKGMVVAMAWHIDANPNSEFVRASKTLWGANVDWKTAMTYDASQALVAAFKQNPTRSGVQKALSSPDFQTPGVSNPIRFADSSSGDRTVPVQLVEVKKVGDNSNSRTGFDFVPLEK
jgi:branched-chain amino acid transport system substrate-binding protein